MTTLSSIINGQSVVNVSAQGRLNDQEIAQCICNASIGALSTRQLLNHFALYQPDRPHASYQAWAVEKGLWATWTTKAGKIKPAGCNERKAELVKLGEDCAELRVLRQYDAIRVMFTADKETANRLHKMEQASNAPQEKSAEKAPEQAISNPLLPLVGRYETVAANTVGRLNRLMAQCALDDNLSWIVDELSDIVAGLKVE